MSGTDNSQEKFAEALHAVAKMGVGFMDVAEDHELRLKDIEAAGSGLPAGKGGDGIRRFRHPAPGNGHRGAGGVSAGGPDAKVFHSPRGEVYELGPSAKMADVIPVKHAPDVSLDRWLAAAMLGERCEDKAAVDFARETKDLSGGTGGILVPEGFQGQWIDNLRANMVLAAAGMQTTTMMQSTVTASRVKSDPDVAWRAEAAALTADDPTFEHVQLVAKSLGVRAQATAELAMDSPDFGQQLLNVMARALAHEIDRVGLVGTGTGNQPTGIHNTSGIGTVTAVGSPTYADLITGLKTVLDANVDLERANRSAIMSPRTWATLEGLQATDNQPIRRPRALEQMTFRPTTAIPDDLGTGENESIIIMGDFSDLVLGIRLDVTVEALRLQTYASNLLLEFVGWARVDYLVRRPASFVELSGVTV